MNIQETISGLEQILFDLDPKAKGIYNAIISLRPLGDEVVGNHNSNKEETNVKKLPNSGYDVNAKMKDKIIFALRNLNRFVKTKEIAEFLSNYEPNMNVQDITNLLSNPLSALKSEQKIYKKETGANRNAPAYWGSLKWVNEDGGIKPEHMYKEEEKQEEIDF